MRFKYFTKTFFYYILITIILLITIRHISRLESRLFSLTLNTELNVQSRKHNLKYILLWTPENTVPFANMGTGRQGFIDRKCPYTNCVVTSNRSLLGDYSNFHVIAFAAPQFVGLIDKYLLPDPQIRSPKQKYVFSSIESSGNYPLCTNDFDGYFNWTWTYKLDSDVRWGYIVIRDYLNNIIGPNKHMNWIDWSMMIPTSKELEVKFKNKTRAAAWFVSNCKTISDRESFALRLQKALKKYSLAIDIFGECGAYSCPRDNETKCNEMISEKYYFYLSFENAFSEDYVTEKILIPLQNNAIPIVFGGANYSRFMPHGSYLNARELGPNNLADKMNFLIKYPKEYAKYFMWKNHYSYHKTADSVETNEYCRMCALLNNDDLVNKKTIYSNIREWWDPYENPCYDR